MVEALWVPRVRFSRQTIARLFSHLRMLWMRLLPALPRWPMPVLSRHLPCSVAMCTLRVHLKVAGVDKGRRTKILEKEILPGKHEIVQGGYGKYQGTWYMCSPLSLQYG